MYAITFYHVSYYIKDSKLFYKLEIKKKFIKDFEDEFIKRENIKKIIIQEVRDTIEFYSKLDDSIGIDFNIKIDENYKIDWEDILGLISKTLSLIVIPIDLVFLPLWFITSLLIDHSKLSTFVVKKVLEEIKSKIKEKESEFEKIMKNIEVH
jgi:hypothetical protein